LSSKDTSPPAAALGPPPMRLPDEPPDPPEPLPPYPPPEPPPPLPREEPIAETCGVYELDTVL